MRRLLLEGAHLTKKFGALVAVNQVDIRLYQGEMLGLIGSNGAGKTTLFDLLCGFQKPDDGAVLLKGRAMQGGQMEFVRRGVTRTFQNLRLFEGMTVKEHLLVSLWARRQALQSTPEALLQNTPLAGMEQTVATSLSYGQMRTLELLRGVATGCDILLLDEPGAGLSQTEKQQLALFLKQLQQAYSISFLVIEHDLEFIADLCNRVYAMHLGQIICHGTAGEVLSDKRVKTAFLGSNTP